MFHWLSSPYLGLALLATLPYFVILNVNNIIAVLVTRRFRDNRIYTALVVVSLLLFVSGVVIFYMAFLGISF